MAGWCQRGVCRGRIKGKPANTGSPGRWQLNHCVCAFQLADINPPDIIPLGQIYQWQGRTKPPGQPPVELEHNVRCRFLLQEMWFWKLNFMICRRKPPRHNPWFSQGGSGPWGYVRGIYVQKSWNLAFMSAMCDSVGFIRPCHWTVDSDLGGGVCPVTDRVFVKLHTVYIYI